jgi:hypothetical protein
LWVSRTRFAVESRNGDLMYLNGKAALFVSCACGYGNANYLDSISV